MTNPCSDTCLVVLVEDDECIRATFSEILECEGYDVLAFSNGRDALDGLDDRRPCLILLDWMMPEMSGEEFLEARADGAAGDSPVVVVSAVSHRARKAKGVAALLNKPVDLDGLLSVVKHHCRNARPARKQLAC